MAQLPAWTQGVLLQDRGVPQDVLSGIDITPNALNPRQVNLVSDTQVPSEIQFRRQGVEGFMQIIPNPEGLIFRTISAGPPIRNGIISTFCNASATNIQAGSITSVNVRVPDSISITPQGEDPKELGNPLLLVQGQTEQIFVSKVCFEYDFDPLTPNFVSLDLSFFGPLRIFSYFLKDLAGVNNIPGAVLTLNVDTSILTITGIPEVAGVCSGMLFFF